MTLITDDSYSSFTLIKPFDTKGAGMSRWAIGEKGGKKYFIKEFIDPKYPPDGTYSSKITRKMRDKCEEFFANRRRFYNALFQCDTGNNIFVREFFRHETKYYAVTELVDAATLHPEQLARLRPEVKLSIIKSLLLCVGTLHGKNIIHSDLKLDNILFKETMGGYCAAKIIDFDSGFLKSEPPTEADDIVGDLVYFAPETIQKKYGEAVTLTEKIDIFALGIILHQIWTGRMPGFNVEKYRYVPMAVLNKAPVTLDSSLPERQRTLIAAMLSRNPENRPSAQKALDFLNGIIRDLGGGDAGGSTPISPSKQTTEDDVIWKHPTFD